MAMKHQTLSKCTFYSNHQLSIAVSIFCWGGPSYSIILSSNRLGLLEQFVWPFSVMDQGAKNQRQHTGQGWQHGSCNVAEIQKSIHFGKPWGPRPRPEGCFVWKNHDFEKSSKFSARFMFFLRITAILPGNNAIHPSDQRLEVPKFGNPMKRSHAEMATDMWEILGFKRDLIQGHSNKDETTPSRLN